MKRVAKGNGEDFDGGISRTPFKLFLFSVREFRSSRLNLQLLVAALIVVFLTSIIISAIAFIFAGRWVTNTTSDLMRSLAQRHSRNIDISIDEIERISYNILLNNNVVRLLLYEDSLTPAQIYTLSRQVESDMAKSTNFRRDMIGMYLYSLNANIYCTSLSKSIKRGYSITEQDWYAEYCTQNRFALYYHETQEQFAVNGDGATISFVKQLNDPRTKEMLGVMELIINDDMLFAKNVNMDTGYGLLIFDKNNRLIHSEGDFYNAGRDSALIYAARAHLVDLEAGHTSAMEYNGGTVLVHSHVSEYTGWSFIVLAPLSILRNSGVSALLVLLVPAVLLSVVFAAIVAIFAARRIFTPLRALKATMVRVAQDSDERAAIAGDDEISELAVIFNGMLDEQDRRMKRNIELEREKDALALQRSQFELDALQSQINPHFLYNALESISLTARMNNDVEAQKMAIALGRLLRLSIIKSERLVTVREEIEHVKRYIELLSICFRNAISLEIDICDEIMEMTTVKLVLQPIVENAVKHGLFGVSGGVIRISAETDADKLRIIVEDNGKGMDAQTMESVNDDLRNRRNVTGTGESIGLANSNKRIQLFYDSQSYGIRIMKSDRHGTAILVVLPSSGMAKGENR